MKKIVFIYSLLLIFTTSCKENKKSETTKDVELKTAQNNRKSEGYKLMEQKCFICHFPVPDRSRKDEMIAPPMLRVQEHYKPVYPNKIDFENAIKEWVKEPTEEKIQMPGAARKFKVMPYMPYTDEEIQLIAEALYEVDFEADYKGKNTGNNDVHGHVRTTNLELNDGKKWQLDKEVMTKVNTINKKLNTFESQNVKEYHELGKEVFNTAKTLILDKDLEDQKFKQVQAFFHDVEGDIHQLMQVKTTEEGQEIQEILKNKFSKFSNFFE